MLAKNEGFFNIRRIRVIKPMLASLGYTSATGVSATLCWLGVEHLKVILDTSPAETSAQEVVGTGFAVLFLASSALVFLFFAVWMFSIGICESCKNNDSIEDAELNSLLGAPV